LNLAEFAAFMDVSPRTVTRAVNAGMPVVHSGGLKKKYDIDPEIAAAWWSANRRTPVPVELPNNVLDLPGRQRREEYLAERERLRLQRDQEQVLDRQEVADAVRAQLTSLRQGFLAVPDKLAKRLGLGRKERAIVEELVSAELHQAAERLSVIDLYERDIA